MTTDEKTFRAKCPAYDLFTQTNADQRRRIESELFRLLDPEQRRSITEYMIDLTVTEAPPLDFARYRSAPIEAAPCV